MTKSTRNEVFTIEEVTELILTAKEESYTMGYKDGMKIVTQTLHIEPNNKAMFAKLVDYVQYLGI